MTRRALALATSLALLLTALASSPVAAAPDRPSSMAAAGDSITRAFNLCFFPFTDCPARSWSTGNNSTVNSHARRLGITGSAFNDAVSGARMADFPSQARTIAGRSVGYVTVLMGGNDVCRDTESQMTEPDVYEGYFRQGMNALASDADSSPPLVYVLSIPDVKVLWEILHTNASARSAWSSYNICQSLLANPLSTDQADVDRRERVKQRNMELNQRLRLACAAYSFCRFDGEGAFGTPFVPSDVSTRDYFHPSTDGQKKLAAVSYDLGYWPTTGDTKAVNQPPAATFGHTCSGLTCTFAASSPEPDVEWSWQFGDGRTSTVGSPTYTFAADGTYNVTLYAIDAAGATASVTKSVTVAAAGDPPANQAPSAGFTPLCDELACTFTDTSADPDGSVVSWSWNFGDGNTSTAQSPAHTYAAGGSYTVSLTVTDDKGATGTTSQVVTVATSSEGASLHVGDLDGSYQLKGKSGKWEVFVTVTIHDDAHLALGAATVTGTWSGAASGTISGSTSIDGTVTFATGSLSQGTSVTFEVDSVAVAGSTYESGDNHDPETDSNGSTITVRR